jgi:hypothetical protein
MVSQSLTENQIRAYKEQGYLILRAEEHFLVTADEVKQWAEDIYNWPSETGKWMAYMETSTTGKKQPMRTEKLIEYHEQLRDLLLGDVVLGWLEQLTEKVRLEDPSKHHVMALTSFLQSQCCFSRKRSISNCRAQTDSALTLTHLVGPISRTPTTSTS